MRFYKCWNRLGCNLEYRSVIVKEKTPRCIVAFHIENARRFFFFFFDTREEDEEEETGPSRRRKQQLVREENFLAGSRIHLGGSHKHTGFFVPPLFCRVDVWVSSRAAHSR